MPIRVALPVPLPRSFDYELPPELPPAPQGARVRVPFGKRELVGIVLGPVARSAAGPSADTRELKAVRAVLDTQSLYTAELWDSLHWAQRYYHQPLGEMLFTALPAGLRHSDGPSPRRPGLWLRNGSQEPKLRGARQLALWHALGEHGLAEAELDQREPGWRTAMTALAKKALVQRIELSPFAPPPILAPAPALNAEQAAAVEAIQAEAGFRCWLLQGVTGSGKTEVYLRLIARCVAEGRQALLLVPEIGLTPQLIRRVRERLPARVAVLHSALSEGERVEAWRAMASGEVDVLVGTRSAAWIALPRPGLIVVDEEHDGSYKQQDGVRYQGRDVAIYRAHRLGIPIVLGSATPSFESLRNVDEGRYQRLWLHQRAGGAQPPSLHRIDLRQQRLQHGLAADTLSAIGRHLGQGGQVLVFRNRRGYAPVLCCHDCGWHAECPRCDASLTVHRRRARLICHHCGYEQAPPRACPDCHSLAVIPQGTGTERLEQALEQAFPDYPTLRLDRDSTARKHSFDQMVAQLADGHPAIVVGTQMLAKGHDWPGVSLGVIVGADDGLYSVDYRAQERLAQLLVQVAGRAGRASRSGEVLVQTHCPDHPLLSTLLRDGYTAWAETALAERRKAGMPPYVAHALIRAEHVDAARAEAFLQAVLERSASSAGVDIAGPLEAPMARRNELARWQLIFTARERATLHATLKGAVDAAYAVARRLRVRWTVDVDPADWG